MVPHIVEILRVPKDPVQPLGKCKRKRSVPPRSRTAESIVIYNPEEGWDKDTKREGHVFDFVTHEEVERRAF